MRLVLGFTGALLVLVVILTGGSPALLTLAGGLAGLPVMMGAQRDPWTMERPQGPVRAFLAACEADRNAPDDGRELFRAEVQAHKDAGHRWDTATRQWIEPTRTRSDFELLREDYLADRIDSIEFAFREQGAGI